MVLALILLADGTEEIEFVTPYDGKAIFLVPLKTFYVNILQDKLCTKPHEARRSTMLIL